MDIRNAGYGFEGKTSWALSIGRVDEVYLQNDGVYADVTLIPSDFQVRGKMISIYAGNGYGLYLPLQKDNIVVVGYTDGDASSEVLILGSLHTSKNTSPLLPETHTSDGKTFSGSSVMSFYTEEGTPIQFYAKAAPIVSISDSDYAVKSLEASVIISSKIKSTVESEKDVEIKAKENVRVVGNYDAKIECIYAPVTLRGLGKTDVYGVITTKSIDPFTMLPHESGSQSVKATM